jgi:hypothetical protein
MPGLIGNSQPIAYGFTLRDGQRYLPGSVNFTLGGLSQNLTLDLGPQSIDCIRSIYVDNVGNDDWVNITNIGLNQVLRIPRKVQGYYPLFQFGQSLALNFSTTIGTGIMNFALLNYDMIPVQFGHNGQLISIIPDTIAATDLSSFIAAGGTSQVVQSGQARRRFIIQNPSTAALQGIAAAEPLFLGFGNAGNNPIGTPSIEIPPGEMFDSGSGVCESLTLRVNATTINHRYMAKVW